MAIDNPNFEYAIIIETNLYAGNFERELCAYVTGAVGECDVGSELSDVAFKECDDIGEIADYTMCYPDDNGCYRPVSIYNLEGDTGYTTLIIFLEQPLPANLAKIVEERAYKFAEESRKNIDAPRLSGRKGYEQIKHGDLRINKVTFVEQEIVRTLKVINYDN